MNTTSLYDKLEIPSSATQDEIKHAYRILARKHHPDRKGGDTEMFKVIQHAYDVLGDVERREKYDASGNEGGGPDIHSVALQQLAQLIFMTIEGFDDRINIIEQVKSSIVDGKKKARDAQSKIPAMIAKYEKASKRIKNKRKKSNMISGMIQHQMKTLQAKHDELGQHILLGDEMLKILEEYNDEVPMANFPQGYFTVSTNL